MTMFLSCWAFLCAIILALLGFDDETDLVWAVFVSVILSLMLTNLAYATADLFIG